MSVGAYKATTNRRLRELEADSASMREHIRMLRAELAGLHAQLAKVPAVEPTGELFPTDDELTEAADAMEVLDLGMAGRMAGAFGAAALPKAGG